MAATPWQVGRHLTVLTVDDLTVNESTGVITPAASPASIRTYVADFDDDFDVDLENIVPTTSQKRNFVPLESGTSFLVQEILRNGSSPGVLLGLVDGGSTHLQVVWDYGASTYTYQGAIQRTSRPHRKGASVYSVQLQPIDNGGANPAIT